MIGNRSAEYAARHRRQAIDLLAQIGKGAGHEASPGLRDSKQAQAVKHATQGHWHIGHFLPR
jgi:hypothetical protein